MVVSGGTSHAAADRNLLFGILALQLDFIRQESLVKAMNRWVLTKAKPLGELLVEQGDLDAEARGLLDALVGKHLALHANDPAKSLAAADLVESVREGLKRIPDKELLDTLGTLSACSEESEDPHATRAPGSASSRTAGGPRYHSIALLARGGLGEVYTAHDEELHRRVALKQLQARFADDPESRMRFLREATITGRLEHPGVVPVYGLSQYPDGRPFYAMRLIQGETLQDYRTVESMITIQISDGRVVGLLGICRPVGGLINSDEPAIE